MDLRPDASSWSSRASTAPRCTRATASSPCPPIPLETSSTPPARATRSPAASSATSPPTPSEGLDDELLRRAMAYGTALASFNVEEFGTERVQRLTGDEVTERVAALAAGDGVRRHRGPASDLRSARRGASAYHRGPMGWTMLYLFVFLKIPIAGLLLDRVVGGPNRGRTPTTCPCPATAAPPIRPRPHPRRPAPPAPAPPRRPARRRRAPGAAAPRIRSRDRCADAPARSSTETLSGVPTSVLSDGTIRRLVADGRIVIDPGTRSSSSRRPWTCAWATPSASSTTTARRPSTCATAAARADRGDPGDPGGRLRHPPRRVLPRAQRGMGGAARRRGGTNRGEVLIRSPRTDRPRHRGVHRPRLEGHAHARAQQPHAGARSSSSPGC